MKLFCNIDPSALAAVGFVLLVVMMIVPQPHHGYGPDLPRVSHAVSMSGAEREDAMVIAVMRDGVVYFGSDRTSPTQLPSKILDRLRDHAVEPRVYIRADRRAFYFNVKEVLDGVRSAGIKRVAFLVDQRRPLTHGP
jgi:biopolymer transport protein ExbD/biopolymer transport protein TolR